MNQDIVIKVENISKKYSIGKKEQYLTLRDKLVELPGKLFKKQTKKEFWALKDISFEVKRGEVLGVIGRNGAGKSTLLKILSRIVEPTSGQITLKGRVASLLEVGTGFNQELTGRENIYLNGSILGMTKKEIKSKFDEIVKFSGIGKFLDTPVKHYSSGMYVRLAFSVAAHLESEILLVDEVLAVGDADFQKKCLGKMDSLAKSGRTVIFVSHDLESVEKLCKRAILLDDGTIKSIRLSSLIIKKYLSKIEKLSKTKTSERKDRSGNGKIQITSINYANNRQKTFNVGDKLVIDLGYLKKTNNLVGIIFGLQICNPRGNIISVVDSRYSNNDINLKNKGVIKCTIQNLLLNSGKYLINIYVGANNETCDFIENAIELNIRGFNNKIFKGKPSKGIVIFNYFWQGK